MDEHISTYALAMMVIFYLQTKNHLLSVKQLKTLNPEPAVIIDGTHLIFDVFLNSENFIAL